MSQQTSVFHRDTGPLWFESAAQSAWRAPWPREHLLLWNRCTWTVPIGPLRRIRSGNRSANHSCRSPRWSSSWMQRSEASNIGETKHQDVVTRGGKKQKTFKKNYTPVDPKQFFHIHVVILAPDVGNFESISMGNSMNYKQHVFMYYCYLGGSMLV